MDETEQVLKQDAAGRVWTPRAQREAALEEFERGGLPATKFAAHIGVKYSTFAAWVAKRRKARSEGSVATGPTPAVPRFGWVEATVERPSVGGGQALWVHLPGGARLEVRDGQQAALAAQLLRALGGGGLAC